MHKQIFHRFEKENPLSVLTVWFQARTLWTEVTLEEVLRLYLGVIIFKVRVTDTWCHITLNTLYKCYSSHAPCTAHDLVCGKILLRKEDESSI